MNHLVNRIIFLRFSASVTHAVTLGWHFNLPTSRVGEQEQNLVLCLQVVTKKCDLLCLLTRQKSSNLSFFTSQNLSLCERLGQSTSTPLLPSEPLRWLSNRLKWMISNKCDHSIKAEVLPISEIQMCVNTMPMRKDIHIYFRETKK